MGEAKFCRGGRRISARGGRRNSASKESSVELTQVTNVTLRDETVASLGGEEEKTKSVEAKSLDDLIAELPTSTKKIGSAVASELAKMFHDAEFLPKYKSAVTLVRKDPTRLKLFKEAVAAGIAGLKAGLGKPGSRFTEVWDAGVIVLTPAEAKAISEAKAKEEKAEAVAKLTVDDLFRSLKKIGWELVLFGDGKIQPNRFDPCKSHTQIPQELLNALKSRREEVMARVKELAAEREFWPYWGTRMDYLINTCDSYNRVNPLALDSDGKLNRETLPKNSLWIEVLGRESDVIEYLKGNPERQNLADFKTRLKTAAPLTPQIGRARA